MSAGSNGERVGNQRKSTDCSAASSSLFLSVFSSLLFNFATAIYSNQNHLIERELAASFLINVVVPPSHGAGPHTTDTHIDIARHEA